MNKRLEITRTWTIQHDKQIKKQHTNYYFHTFRNYLSVLNAPKFLRYCFSSSSFSFLSVDSGFYVFSRAPTVYYFFAFDSVYRMNFTLVLCMCFSSYSLFLSLFISYTCQYKLRLWKLICRICWVCNTTIVLKTKYQNEARKIILRVVTLCRRSEKYSVHSYTHLIFFVFWQRTFFLLDWLTEWKAHIQIIRWQKKLFKFVMYLL